MSYCEGCGTALSDGASFCGNCGRAVSTAAAPQAAPAPAPDPYASQAGAPQWQAPAYPPAAYPQGAGIHVPVPDKYATWARRAGGAAIDLGYLTLIFGVLALLVRSSGGFAVAYVFAYFAWRGFAYLRPMPNLGQTVGRQAVNVRVERIDGRKIGLDTFMLRSVVPWLFGLLTCGLFWIVSSLWPIWDDKRQTLGDKLASTIVYDLSSEEVHDRPATLTDPTPLAIGAGVCCLIGIALYWLSFWTGFAF